MGGGEKDGEGSERRTYERFPTYIEVDCRSGEHFLFAYIANISEIGIFLRSDAPLPVGSRISLRFEHGGAALELEGEVVWINPVMGLGESPNAGMGIRFENLTDEGRERVVELVRTIAYLEEERTN